MEIKPEIYTYLINSKIIESNKNMNVKSNGKILLTDELTQGLIDGTIFKKLLKQLEVSYNKYYRLNLNHTSILDKMNTEIRSNSVMYLNWSLIGECLNNFGIDFDQMKLGEVNGGNRNVIIEILTSVFTLSHELSLRTKDPKVQNNKVKSDESVDINNFNTTKEIILTESPLEFFLLTLIRALNVTVKQAAALLANNRKYLVEICHRGIKSDYTKINLWFQEVALNERHLAHLIKYSKESSRSMSFAIIGTGFVSKNHHISVFSYNIIQQLNADIGLDKEWLDKEGIESIIYCITKHKELRVDLLNMLFDFHRGAAFELVRNILKIYLPKKEKLFEFFSEILPKLKSCHSIVFRELSELIYNTCIKETYFIDYSVNVLTSYWIHLLIDDNEKCTAILNYLKGTIKEDKQKQRVISISLLFHILEYLSKKTIKHFYAPILYKTLVFLFLEHYDNSEIREDMINRFIYLLLTEITIPIDILFDPYLKQLESTENYDSNDFKFLSSVLEHPKFSVNILREIITFIFRVATTNYYYYRSATLLFNTIYEKGLFKEQFYYQTVNFIQGVLSNFIKNNDPAILLELPYEIMNLRIDKINEQVENNVIEAVKAFKRKNKKHSTGLLAMLWFSDKHDTLLLYLEEDEIKKVLPKSTSRYLPIFSKKVFKLEETKEYPKKSPGYFIERIREKRRNAEIEKKVKIQTLAEKEKRIKKALLKKLEQKSLEMGNNISKIIGPSNNYSIRSNEMLQKEIKSLIITKESHEKNIKRKPRTSTAKLELEFYEIVLEEEELREQRAIEVLLKKFQKNLKYYFTKYISNKEFFITKPEILKIYRNLGFTNSDLSLDELNIIVIKLQKNFETINRFKFEEFKFLLMQISFFLIQTKFKKSLSLSEAFFLFLDFLTIPKIKNYNKILNKIKQIYNYNQLNQRNTLLPPGIIVTQESIPEYHYTIPSILQKNLSEAHIITLEIIHQLIYNCLQTCVLEPFIEIKNITEFNIDVSLPKWRESIILAYCNIEKDYYDVCEECANVLEEILNAVEYEKPYLGKSENLGLKDREEQQRIELFIEEEKRKKEKRKERNRKLKQQIEIIKKLKEDEKQRREEENEKRKEKKEEKLKLQLLKERKLREEQRKEYREQRKAKENEEKQKDLEKQEKENLKQKQKHEERKRFLNKQKKRLKDQIKSFKLKNKDYNEKQQEALIQQLPRIPKRNEEQSKKLKEKNEFEKNLNEKMETILNSSEIKEIFDLYEKHIHLIFDVYWKIGSNKLKFFVSDVLRLNEFKEFLLNFTVIPLILNVDQMNYIYKKIKKNVNYENGMTIDEFRLSLLYLAVMTHFCEKSIKIYPSYLDKFNPSILRTFFEFLNFKSPFIKTELEDFICIRRAFTVKQRLTIQNDFKRNHFKRTELDIDTSSIKKSRSKSKSRSKERAVNKKRSEITVKNPEGKEEKWDIE